MNKTKSHKYNYFYKITNIINNHFYYGVHSTDNLNDGYMGSGNRLKYAYKKYGIENFTKEILKYFDNVIDAYKYEEEIVSESLVNANECYNLVKGGCGSFGKPGYVTVKDTSGNYYYVSVKDERYLSGELIPIAVGYVSVKDASGNCYQVSVKDERYLSGELQSVMKGRVIVKDNIGNNICVNMLDPRYINGEYKPVNSGKCFYKDKNNNIVFTSINDSRVLSGELIHTTRGRITVKDKNGNFYSVYKNDPRLLSGELVFNCTGHKLSEETKQKLSKNHKDNAGVKNGQYGKHWYHMKINGKMLNKMLSDNEYQMYKQDGWIKGRILNKDIHGKIQKNDI